MFWSIFINSLVLIIGILVIGWLIDKAVRSFTDSSSDNN